MYVCLAVWMFVSIFSNTKKTLFKRQFTVLMIGDDDDDDANDGDGGGS